MIWKIWKYALGSFADDKTRDYDNVVARFDKKPQTYKEKTFNKENY